MGEFGIIVLCLLCVTITVWAENSDNSEDSDHSLETEEQLAEATKRAMAESCRTANTTDEDIKAFLDEDLNPSYEAKCLGACILKKFDIITQDGKFNVEGAKNLYQIIETDKQILELRYEVIDQCKDVEHNDVCEFSYKLGQCIDEKGEELGVGDW